MSITAEYQTYLRSPKWDKVRRQALYDARYRCERCGISAPLQVHHLTYRNIFNEKPQDLQALCFSCHKWVHIATWQKAAIISFRAARWFFRWAIGL